MALAKFMAGTIPCPYDTTATSICISLALCK